MAASERSRDTCPKCGQPRTAAEICAHCGVVYFKYERYLERRARGEAEPNAWPRRGAGQASALAPLLAPTDEVRRYRWAFAVLWAVFVAWGWTYIASGIEALGRDPGFLHAVNLPFHEFGHLLFGLFGQWIGSLGGTLGQLAVPVVCAAVLLRQRGDTFGASLCLWWFGQNFIDIAPYIADARAGTLPLLGGNYGNASPYGFHDWEYLLGETGLLAWDGTIAALAMNLGRALMIAAMLWGLAVLHQAWRKVD